MAATGKQLKQSVKVFHSFMLYRRLPTNERASENLMSCQQNGCDIFPVYKKYSALTLVIKAVDSINRGAFVVSTEQEKVLWIFDLVGEKQADGLQ